MVFPSSMAAAALPKRRRSNLSTSGLTTMAHVSNLSFALNVVFSLVILFLVLRASTTVSPLLRPPGNGPTSTQVHWNGGHPSGPQSGSCFCSSYDLYCMCTPSLAIDLVIISGSNQLWLVRRKDTNQLATMGGFVQIGETSEDAVRRELKEETGIDISTPLSLAPTRKPPQPVLFGIYSDPRRDNRRHTVSVVYAIHLEGTEHPKAADDVKEVKLIDMEDIEKYEYFADHKTILLDYRAHWYQRQSKTQSSQRRADTSTATMDFAPDIKRSRCSMEDAATSR